MPPIDLSRATLYNLCEEKNGEQVHRFNFLQLNYENHARLVGVKHDTDQTKSDKVKE